MKSWRKGVERLVWAVLAGWLCVASAAGAAHPYGGLPIRVARPGRYFRLKRIGRRWVFVTPHGNAFWMLGVYDVDTPDSPDNLPGKSYNDRVLKKYGSRNRWAEAAVKRLRSWGFNTIGEYASLYVLPTPSPYGGKPNPEKMPFVALVRPSYYGLRDADHLAAQPFKNLMEGLDPAVYHGWRGNGLPDVFDPNFAAYVQASVRALTPKVLQSPWLVGITVDDADDLVGFGPGPQIHALRLHPNPAWIVLCGNFQQLHSAREGVTYSDPKVYSKYALRDFLEARYHTIANLNRAWGSDYTTFDSDGGWGRGRGLLDENGRHRWIGADAKLLATANPAVRRDLNDFLYVFAHHYFQVAADAVHQEAPGHLAFGPASLNGWGGLTRREILRAAAGTVDVLQAGISGQLALNLTARYTGDMPIVTWEGLAANRDSELSGYPGPEGSDYASQADRGRLYQQNLDFLVHARAADGSCPVVGLKLWAWSDSWGEKANWGLVDLLDHPYDGHQDTTAHGEPHSYGDFISYVRSANEAVAPQLTPVLRASLGSRGGARQARLAAPVRK